MCSETCVTLRAKLFSSKKEESGYFIHVHSKIAKNCLQRGLGLFISLFYAHLQVKRRFILIESDYRVCAFHAVGIDSI